MKHPLGPNYMTVRTAYDPDRGPDPHVDEPEAAALRVDRVRRGDREPIQAGVTATNDTTGLSVAVTVGTSPTDHGREPARGSVLDRR